MSDYYTILGVDRRASKDEIKSAYKQLALKYHPDTAAELSEAQQREHEQKFKAISEAYAVLSDETKKRQYDTFGNQQFQQQYSQHDIFAGADFSPIFDELNIKDIGDIFAQAFAGSRRAGRIRAQAQDVIYPLKIGLEEAMRGGQKSIQYHLPRSGSEQLTVKIPPGVRSGTKLKVPRKGAYGAAGERGDLLVKISFAPHPVYVRSGDDLVMSHKITLSKLLLGGKIELETCDGLKTVHLASPASLQAKLRLKGLGFPVLGAPERRGDLYCELVLDLPSKLTAAQRQVALDLQAAEL